MRSDLDWVVDRGKGSVADLERILKISPGTVDLWRRGAAPIPKRAIEEIQFFRKVFEFEEKTAALALAECATERSLFAEMERLGKVESEAKGQLRATQRWVDHRERCATCLANTRRIAAEVGPSPFALDRDLRITSSFNRWSARPWTLLLTIPASAAAFFALPRLAGPDLQFLRLASAVLGAFFLRMVFIALSALWRRLRD